MEGAIYLLSRKVTGSNGEAFMQNVTVFATSASHAKTIVNEQFARIRRISTEDGAYDALPEFAVDKVTLDRHKMITAGVTS